MHELFSALPRLLNEFEDNSDVREAVVFAGWRRIAGKSLGEHTVPFRLFGKHLVIAVADKIWKRHLELLSGQMIFKLNSVVGREVVTFIEFRIDPETVSKNRPESRRIAGRDDPDGLKTLTPELVRSAEAIKDADLREKFLGAAGSCLARKARMSTKKP